MGSAVLYSLSRYSPPPAPLECGLRRLCRRPRRPPQLQLRTRFLPRSIRPHSPNLHLRCLTIPASLPIAHPISLSLLRGQRTRYSNFGLCPEPAAWKRPPSSRRLSSCRQPSFSRLSFLLRTSSSLTFSYGLLSSSSPASFFRAS